MAKKKTGHVAIPFLITLLLSIVGIGGVAMYLFGMIGQDDVEVKKMQSSIIKPTSENNMTLLFVLDEQDNASLPTTFLIARVLPADKKIALLSFPENMLSVVDGRQDTLGGFYRNGGIQSAQAAIESEAGIASDRYMILNSEAFQKICDYFGGVNYLVPPGINGMVSTGKPDYLSPHRIEQLITYPFFDQGEIERNALTSDVISEMINQTDTDRIVQNLDRNFKALINMVDTDITSIDYSNEESALKYLYKYGNSPICSFRLVIGEVTESGDAFLLNSNFYTTVSDLFDQAPAAAGE